MGRSDTRLYFGLTEAGKIILRGIAFIALAAVIVPAFGVLSALISVILTGLVIGFILRPKLRLISNLPDRVVVNHALQLKYLVKNIGRFPVYNLSMRFEALPDTIELIDSEYQVPRLGSGDTNEVTITIRPKRRGHYRIKQPVCQSSFPFKLFSFGRTSDEQERLIVLPSFSYLRILPRRLKPINRYDSSILVGRTGAFPEYMGSRPFLPGDSQRRIDVRAWARLAVPATKEYNENLDSSTALVLDTSMSGIITSLKSGDSKEFEAAVSLCASAAYTINDNCLVDFFVAGPNLYQFFDWPKKMRLDKIHEILAGIEQSMDYTPDCMEPILAEMLHEISEFIFIIPRWSEIYHRLLEMTGRAGCYSTVFVIGESDKIDSSRHEVGRTENIRILAPEEILTEKVMRS
jgi:uncharacterized protein (DUF58 family)